MPILHLKNKVTISIINEVDKALDVGGIPDFITLYPNEGFQLLKEIQELDASRFLFKQPSQSPSDEPDVRFLLKQRDKETRKTILRRWHDETYDVFYVHASSSNQAPEAQALVKSEKHETMIPLKIVKPKESKHEEKDSSS